MRAASSRVKKHGFYLLATFCFIGFALLQFRADGSIVERNDSKAYLGISTFPVSEILSGRGYCFDQHYCQSRPVLIPLIYKLCRQNLHVIVIFQLVFSLISWLYFAGCAIRLLKRSVLRGALFVLLLGLGSTPNLSRWSKMIMSESITLSLTLIWLGLLFLIGGKKVRISKIWWVVVLLSALLLMARDASNWLVLFGALLLICCGWNEQRKAALGTALLIVLCCGVGLLTMGDRWKYSYDNVLFVRLLNDPRSEAWFMDQGMPRPREVDQLKGYKHTQTFPVYNSEALRSLREWVAQNGRRVYARWLLYRAMDSLRAPWYGTFEREAYETIDSIYQNDDYHALLPEALAKFFSLNMPGVFYALLGLAGLTAALVRQHSAFGVPSAFVLMTYFFCALIYSLDAYDFARQSVETLLCMRGSAWLCIGLALDQINLPGQSPIFSSGSDGRSGKI